jgi:hypothetical protein
MFGRRRDERYRTQFEDVLLYHGVGPVEVCPTLVAICSHRQRARTGLKAYLTFPPYADVYATWIAGWWPPVGAHLVVSGHFWDKVDETHHREVDSWSTLFMRWPTHQSCAGGESTSVARTAVSRGGRSSGRP